MKKTTLTLTLLLGIVLYGTSNAATPITDIMAEKYFANCITGAQKEGTMTTNTQKKYCACTAMNMQKSMSQEDLKALTNHDDSARLALNKILLDVNGPCMEYPTHDLLNKKCMTDVKNESICSCLSNKMGLFMKNISKRMLPQILADNSNIFDPMTPIMESQEFITTKRQVALSCATNPNSN